jgi:hypothetical protein
MVEYIDKLKLYIKKNLKKGYTQESLKWALVNQGYTRSIVERAIDQVNAELAEKAPVLKSKPIIKYEIIDEHDRPVTIKKPWWKKLFE